MAGFFDEYGQREWDRFDTAPGGRANLEIHRRFIFEFIEPGWRVLDVGAGPGRFTIELAHLGARTVVADVSTEQLRLNREYVTAAGLDDQVEQRLVADVVDLSEFEGDSVDASVCFGGPLSYVLDRADDAVAELVRITRPGGVLLVSVMSLLGSARRAGCLGPRPPPIRPSPRPPAPPPPRTRPRRPRRAGASHHRRPTPLRPRPTRRRPPHARPGRARMAHRPTGHTTAGRDRARSRVDTLERTAEAHRRWRHAAEHAAATRRQITLERYRRTTSRRPARSSPATPAIPARR